VHEIQLQNKQQFTSMDFRASSVSRSPPSVNQQTQHGISYLRTFFSVGKFGFEHSDVYFVTPTVFISNLLSLLRIVH